MHASSVIGKLMVHTLLVFPRIKQHEPNYSKLCSTIPATHTETDRQTKTDRQTDRHSYTDTHLDDELVFPLRFVCMGS